MPALGKALESLEPVEVSFISADELNHRIALNVIRGERFQRAAGCESKWWCLLQSVSENFKLATTKVQHFP